MKKMDGGRSMGVVYCPSMDFRFNFIPSGSMTGSLWLFQEYGHKEAFRDAAREIALAAELGFNSIRMVLPFEVYTGRKRKLFHPHG